MGLDLRACLTALVAGGGSDLHLKVGRPPLGRYDGVLRPILPDAPELTADDTDGALRHMLSDPEHAAAFAVDHELDLAHHEPGVARLRVNAFRQRGLVSIVCRVVPDAPTSIEELGLPPVVAELADEERGLVLVTGITGSGKSTTLAAMVDRINRRRACHVVTIEDPIEMLHQDRMAVVNQREVGTDTAGFGQALRRVLRQDPDVILIGELRDEETVRAALSAAETGHLVLSTVHTIDAAEAVGRLVGFFPPHQHTQIRAMLATTLQGVVSQRLVPLADGPGRRAVCEVLRATGLVRDVLRDAGRTGELNAVIAEGAHYGMQTFDQALCRLVLDGVVAREDAMRAAARPHDLDLLLRADGRAGTSMADVADQARRGAQGPGDAPAGGSGGATGGLGGGAPAAGNPVPPVLPAV
jgi:twitching motility protein PilT